MRVFYILRMVEAPDNTPLIRSVGSLLPVYGTTIFKVYCNKRRWPIGFKCHKGIRLMIKGIL